MEYSKVDLIIPAYNEAENIPALFDALEPLVGPGRLLRRVIVANNRSTDATAELAAARGAVVVHESHPGYGAACLAGITEARLGPEPAEVVAFLDADLSDDPAELVALLGPLLKNEADLVIGQRLAQAERGAIHLHQRFGSLLACVLMLFATGRWFRDLGPMRALTAEALDRLQMQDKTWGWTVEMQHKAVTRRLRVLEVDVPYRNRHAGVSKISGSLIGSYKAGVKIISTIGVLWLSERKKKRLTST